MKNRMIENAEIAVAEVYSTLGMAPTTSREEEHVMVRAAIGATLCRYMSDANAGKVLGKDRTTVTHYKRNHDNNMTQWIGYSDVYAVAKNVISVSIDNSLLDGRIQALKTRMLNHEQEIVKLQESIELLEAKKQYV